MTSGRRIGGVVLCGGRSSRMGRPKAWLPVGQETMLARIVRLLSSVVSPIILVAAPKQSLPPLEIPCEIVRDPVGGRGPLEGIAQGLSTLQGRVQAAYVSSCDVPLLRPRFVERMIALLGEHMICIPEVDGYCHPLAAVYQVEVAEQAKQLLQAGLFRPVYLLDRVPSRRVTLDEFRDVDPQADSLRNTNTPPDYEAVLRTLGLHPAQNALQPGNESHQ